MVYTVRASAVISPSTQWLDSYAKTRLKMWHVQAFYSYAIIFVAD